MKKFNMLILFLLFASISSAQRYYYIRSSCANCGSTQSDLHVFYSGIINADEYDYDLKGGKFYNKMIEQYPEYIEARNGAESFGYQTWAEAINARRESIAGDLDSDFNIYYINDLGSTWSSGLDYWETGAKYFVYQFGTCANCGPDNEGYLFVSRGITLVKCSQPMAADPYSHDYSYAAFFNQIKIDHPDFENLPRNPQESNCYESLFAAKSSREDLISDYKSSGYKVKYVGIGFNSSLDFPFSSSPKKTSNQSNAKDRDTETEFSMIGYYVQLKTAGDAAMNRLDYNEALKYYEQAKALNVAVDKSELDSKIYEAKQGQFGNSMADLAMTDVGYGTYHGHFMLGLFLGSTSIEGAPPFDIDGTALISMPIHVENYYNLHITKWLGIDFGGELTLPIVFSYDNIVDGTFTKASVVSAPIRAGLNLGNVLSAFYVIQWDKVKAEHRINGSTVLYGTESMIQSNGYGISIGWTKTKDAYYRLNYVATSAGNEEERDFPFLDNQSISLDFGMNLMAIKAFYKKQTINDGEIRPIEAKYWGVAFGFRLPF